MEEKLIVTIGRQFGSRGRIIGKMLANKLGVPYYDKEMIQQMSKESGITQDLFENVNEKQNKSFLYSLVMGSYTFGSRVSTLSDMSMNDKLFMIQSNVVKRLAKTGSCVIVGRCADYILRDCAAATNVFIHANHHDRVGWAEEHYDLDEATAEDMVVKTDKKRANYYNYYSSQNWGQAENYHLCVNSSVLGDEDAVKVIETFARLKQKEAVTEKDQG